MKLVEILCLDNFGAEIYVRVVKLFSSYLDTNLPKLLSACDSSNHISFLTELNVFWLEYCAQLSMIQNVFVYLDRTYVLENSSIPSLWDAGLNIFRSIIIDAQKINQSIYSLVLRTIQTERQGEPIDRPLLKSVIRMFITLQTYENVGYYHSSHAFPNTLTHSLDVRTKAAKNNRGMLQRRKSGEDRRTRNRSLFTTRISAIR